MSAKDEYTEQLIWQHQADTSELIKLSNIVKEQKQGILDDLQGLYEDCLQKQQQWEKKNG